MGKRKARSIGAGENAEETEEQRRERKRVKKEQKKRMKNDDKKEKKWQKREPQSGSRDVDDDSNDGIGNNAVAVPSPDATGDEVFFRKRLELTISLLPSALGNVLANIEDALRLFLLKYSDGIGGILLAFENVKTLLPKNISNRSSSNSNNNRNVRQLGMILNELPHIHYAVSAEALVFCPAPGRRMTGAVTDASFHSHLSLVVHQYFNASVSAEHLRAAGFDFDDVQLQWYYCGAHGNGDDTIATTRLLSKDDRIEFVCQKMYESGGIISLEGSQPALKM